MKKLLGIVVLSLLLSSCASSYSVMRAVNLNNYYVVVDAVGHYGWCYGTIQVTNKSQDTKNPSFKITAHDRNGTNIDSVSFNFENLYPGETISRKKWFERLVDYGWGCDSVYSINVYGDK